MHHRSNLECAVEAAARLDNILARQGKIKPPSLPLHNSIKPSEIFSSEFIINDLPQSARAVLTKGITCEEISSFSGTKITVKGGILSPEEKEKGTEKKPLHLFIQGPNKQSIDLAIQRINNLVLEISQCNNNPLMTANMSQPPPQYINVVQNMQGVEKVLVGLDHAPPSFDVRNKVLGPGGANLAYIMQETGAGVTLRGKGSGFLEAHSGQESLEPLHICVEHNKPEVLQNARQLAFSLIETLQRELQNQQQQMQQQQQQMQQQQQQIQQQTQLVQQVQVTQAVDQMGNIINLQPGEQLPQGVQLSSTTIQVPILTQPFTQAGQTGVQPGTVTLLQASGGQPGQHILLGQNQAVHLAQLQQIPGGSPGQVMLVQYQPTPQGGTIMIPPPGLQQALPPQPVPEPNDGTQQQGPPQQQQQTSVNAPGNPGAQGSNVAPSVNGNIGPGNVTSNENKSEVKPDIKVEKDSSSSSSHPPPPQQASVPPSQRAPPRNVQRGHAATPGSKPVPPPTGGAGAPQSGVPHGQKRSYEEIYQ
ncbi:KH homology domain-containing protein 4-like, partial [Diaphorina citri]|uniref:KH homology domain-containing protein 4 n=1 Tax=Diaphorina citri TaxID=121845 RepID=A0A3Q0JD86_DIACI